MLDGATANMPELSPAATPLMEAARHAIVDTVRGACEVPVAEALDIQARHSGGFMTSKACLSGTIGAMYKKTWAI